MLVECDLSKSHSAGPGITTAPENQTVILDVDETYQDGIGFIPLNVTFSCIASGTPRPVIVWTFSHSDNVSDYFTVDETISVQEMRSSLTLVVVQTSVYTITVSCNAANDLGTDDTQATLTILCKHVT